MKKIALLLFMVFSLQQAICQEFNIVSHTVKLGESVRMLSKKYRVAPSEIYKLNKFAIDGIREGMVLQIPVEQKEIVVVEEIVPTETISEPTENTEIADGNENVQELKHQVEKGETLFSLAKKYNITVDELKRQNEKLLEKGLKSGVILTIRTNN